MCLALASVFGPLAASGMVDARFVLDGLDGVAAASFDLVVSFVVDTVVCGYAVTEHWEWFVVVVECVA